MKTLSQIIEAVCILAAFAGFLWLIYYSLSQWGKKTLAQAQEYDDLYRRIKIAINDNDATVDEANYHKIYAMLVELGGLKYKCREMTSVLNAEFSYKYKAISEKIVAEVGDNV